MPACARRSSDGAESQSCRPEDADEGEDEGGISVASSAPGSGAKVTQKKVEATRLKAAQKFAKAAALEEQQEEEQKVERQIAEIVAELRVCPEKISRTLRMVQGDFLRQEDMEDRRSSNMYACKFIFVGLRFFLAPGVRCGRSFAATFQLREGRAKKKKCVCGGGGQKRRCTSHVFCVRTHSFRIATTPPCTSRSPSLSGCLCTSSRKSCRVGTKGSPRTLAKFAFRGSPLLCVLVGGLASGSRASVFVQNMHTCVLFQSVPGKSIGRVLCARCRWGGLSFQGHVGRTRRARLS